MIMELPVPGSRGGSSTRQKCPQTQRLEQGLLPSCAGSPVPIHGEQLLFLWVHCSVLGSWTSTAELCSANPPVTVPDTDQQQTGAADSVGQTSQGLGSLLCCPLAFQYKGSWWVSGHASWGWKFTLLAEFDLTLLVSSHWLMHSDHFKAYIT